MAFKLKFQGKSKNPYSNIVSKGLVTPAHLIEGPGDEKKETKEEVQNRIQREAQAAAEKAEKVKLKPGDPGYDPTKKASYKQTGKAGYETKFTPEGNEAYKNMSQAERDAADARERKRIQDAQKTIYSYDDKDKTPEPEPEPDYSYLDGATFGSGYRAGDFTTYGLQLMSKVGDDDPRAKSQQREGPDPMSRYLTQDELDYLKTKGKLKGKYRSGYDDYYKQFSPDSETFQKGVERGLINPSGTTIQMEQPTTEDNLFKESGLAS